MQILKYMLRVFCLLIRLKGKKFCFNKGIHGKVACSFHSKKK